MKKINRDRVTQEEADKVKRDLRYLALISLVIVSIGSVLMMTLEKLAFIDAPNSTRKMVSMEC